MLDRNLSLKALTPSYAAIKPRIMSCNYINFWFINKCLHFVGDCVKQTGEWFICYFILNKKRDLLQLLFLHN